MKIIFILIFICSFLSSKEDIFLQINTAGHKSIIRDIIITKDKDIITASDDKTVKVWDSKTGKEKRTFLGEMQTGSNGKVFAIALTPDENYLAIGGFLYGVNSESFIRIYNYQTGKLLRVLNNHNNVIDDLSFSPNGQYLVSSSTDTVTNIWEVNNNFNLFDTIEFKKCDTSELGEISRINSKIISYQNSKYIVATGFDNKIVLYDISTRRIVKEYRLNFNTEFMDISSKHIAVSGQTRQIHILNFDLERIHTIESKTAPWGLSYNKSSDKLYTGAIDDSVQSFDVENNYSSLKTYPKKYSFTLPKEIDNNTVLSVGGDKFGIYFFDTKSTKLTKKIESSGDKIWSIGIKENYIGYSNKWTGTKGRGELDKIINLDNFNINVNKNIKFKKISALKGYKTLTINRNNSSQLLIKDYGKETGKIVRDGTNGRYHYCYGWFDDYILSGGINGYLKIYNKNGEVIANLKGHSGAVQSIAFDGTRLVSGGDDQIIKVWDLKKLNKKTIFNEKYIRELMTKYNKSRNGILDEAKKRFWNGVYKEQELTPILSIFITNKDQYIAWTNEGFFDASKGAEKYIGYHINQGVNKEAEFVAVDALYSTFYRPDLIQKALDGESLESYAKNINIDKLLKNGLPPEVHILTQSTDTAIKDLDLKVQICPKGNGGYDNLALMINDIPVSVVDTSRAFKLKKKSEDREDCFVYNQTISLLGGKNTIGFKATNKAGNIESKPDYLEVTFDDTNLKKKLRTKLSKISGSQNINDLHILAIAVNEYKDRDLTLKYSINDATEMLKTIQDVAKPLFNKVHTYKLFDKEVTKENIKQAFKDIKSTREDVFLLYIAGHGITDEYNGNYYYIPYDFINKDDEKAVQTQGVGQKDLMLGLSKVTALKSLVLLDTCNSGSFVEANMQKTTTNRLARATGRATISASSSSQVAYEGYKGHGVFTYTLIEALKGKGYKNDSKITINELNEYVEDTLPNRTDKKWGYRQMPQSSMYGVDFNIGVK